MENYFELPTNNTLHQMLSDHDFNKVIKPVLLNQHQSSPIPLTKKTQSTTNHFMAYCSEFNLVSKQEYDEEERSTQRLYKIMSVTDNKHLEQLLCAMEEELRAQLAILKRKQNKILAYKYKEKTIASPPKGKEKVLALSLDETLIYSLNGKTPIFLKGSISIIKKVSVDKKLYSFIERPFLNEFLSNLSRYFTIVVHPLVDIYEHIRRVCSNNYRVN